MDGRNQQSDNWSSVGLRSTADSEWDDVDLRGVTDDSYSSRGSSQEQPVGLRGMAQEQPVEDEWEPVDLRASRPRTEEQEGFFRGAVRDVGGGLADLGEMYGRGIRALPGGAEAGVGGGAGGALITKAKGIKEQYDLEPKERTGISRWIHGGIRAATTSLAAGAPGALAGIAATSWIPIPGARVLGAIVGYALGGATLFGVAEYDSTLEDALKAGIDHEKAEAAAIRNGLFEGGLEFGANILEGATMGAGRVVTAPAKAALKNGIKSMFKVGAKQAIKRGIGVAAIETGSEMLTAGLQTEEYYKLGLTKQRFYDAAIEAFGPALVASFIFAGVAEGGLQLNRRRIEKILKDPDAKPEERMAVAKEVYDKISTVDKDLAEQWSDSAYFAIANGEAIPVDEALDSDKELESAIENREAAAEELIKQKQQKEQEKPKKPVSAARATLLDEDETDVTAKELLTGEAPEDSIKAEETAMGMTDEALDEALAGFEEKPEPEIEEGELPAPKTSEKEKVAVEPEPEPPEFKQGWDTTPMEAGEAWDAKMNYFEFVRGANEKPIKALQDELESLKGSRDKQDVARRKEIGTEIKRLKAQPHRLLQRYDSEVSDAGIAFIDEARKRAKKAGVTEDKLDSFVQDFSAEISQERPYIERNYNKTLETIFNEVMEDYLLGKIEQAGVAKEEAPVKLKPELKKVGSSQTIMGTDVIVVGVKRKGGVDYELYLPRDSKAEGGFVRIYDSDSGEVVGITKHSTFEQAEAEYNKNLKEAVSAKKAKKPEGPITSKATDDKLTDEQAQEAATLPYSEPAERKAKKPAKPEEKGIAIPVFADTTQAVAFGRKASPEQITELKRLRQESEKRYYALAEKENLDEAGNEAVRAQFYREAIEAAEGKEHIEAAIPEAIEPKPEQKAKEPKAPKKAVVEPESKLVADATADEMLAEWDKQVEGAKEAEQVAEPKPEQKAKEPKVPVTAAEKAVEAKTHLANMAEDFKAINEILGEKGVVFEGKVDEERWQKIKPLLKHALNEAVAAGRSAAEFASITIKSLGPKGRPYFEKFVKEEMGKEAADDNIAEGGQGRKGEKTDDKGRPGVQGAEDVPGAEGEQRPHPIRKRPGETTDVGVSGGMVEGDILPSGTGTKRGLKPDRTSPGVEHGAKEGVGGNLEHVPGLQRRDQRADYTIKPGSLKREGSWNDAAKNNLDAIELLNKIEEEQRPATFQEQQVLAKYVGWGATDLANNMFPGYAQFGRIRPDYALAGWESLVERLTQALTPEEIRTAAKSTKYAHYTNEGIIGSIYKALARMGFTGGKILEPGSGIGNFVGLLPAKLRNNSTYTGIEMDATSARIAKLLYPNHNMMQGDFIRQSLPKDFFDAAIGNPPFGSIKILGDPEYRKHRFSLHNFFFAKAIDRVRPGGFLVFVTSRYAMDARQDKAREYIADRADLLGAIRLPETAFKASAGTEVVTDVLFLRKRAVGEERGGEAWKSPKQIEVDGEQFFINEYFVAHPEMVLGKHSAEGKMYAEGLYTVKPAEGELESLFAIAAKNLPTNIAKVSETVEKTYKEQALIERDFDPKNKKEGGIYVADDGTLMKVDSGSGVPIDTMHKVTPATRKFLKSYIKLRDALKLSHKVQLEGGDWEVKLEELNKEYDAFVKKHGNILAFTESIRTKKNEDGTTEEFIYRKCTNEAALCLDYESSLVCTLEQITEDGDIVRSKVLQARTVNKPTVAEIKSIPDALAVSLDTIGTLDVAHVAKTAGKTEAEVISTLGDLIYNDPNGSGYVLADEYLSGNVVRKLAEARFAAESDPSFDRNVSALEKSQPTPLTPKQIVVTPGVTWAPVEYYNQFAEEVLELPDTIVNYQPIDNSWRVAGDYSPTGFRGSLRNEWSTPERGANEILLSILNNRAIKVVSKVEGVSFVDTPATTLANETAKAMKKRFGSWVWEDSGRAKVLLDIYNTKVNVIKGREFDGSHLTLPGLSQHFFPYDFQKRVIWRILQTGNAYMAHAVGSGKTFAMIAAGMEMRRLGMINKPIYVVPKHMLGQFAREFQEFYPLANILVADEKSFHTENRRRFMAQAALNDPDAIVMTHSSFGKIGIKEETLAPVRNEFLSAMRHSLREMEDEGESRMKLKRMEKRIEQAEQRFNSLIASGDQAVSFEELGADYVFVDECFTYDTLVETDIGLIKIGDIVEKKLQVNVKSLNFETHVVEWQPVVNWYRKDLKTNLIEVSHEKGSFICTPNHRVWTKSGLKKAEDIVIGEELYLVREDVYSELHREARKEREVLFRELQGYSGNYYKSMLGMQNGVLFQDKRTCEQCEEEVLFNVMSVAIQGKKQNIYEGVEAEDAINLGKFSFEGEEICGDIYPNENEQSNVQQGITGQDEENSYRQEVSCEKGWQRANDGTARKISSYNRYDSGICCCYKGNKGENSQPSESLQSGLSLSSIHDSCGNRRKQSQSIKGTTERQKKGHGVIITRMVSIKVLERGSNGEYQFCGRDHKNVYDIEVERNHNYFANGVLVSNSHEFRKLDFTTNRQMKGIDPQGSRRAIDLYIKIMWLAKHSPGRSHTFASGTPVVNTIGELFTIQRFFDSGEMEADGINHFDAWANMFGESAVTPEMDAAGNYKPVERFSRFVNIPELMSRVRMFMDVLTNSQLGSRVKRPKIKGGVPEIVLAPRNPALQAYQTNNLVPRIETSQNWRPSSEEPGNPDPLINIITDGKLASIDMRFVDPQAVDDPDSKLNKFIDGIIDTFFQTKDMVFATAYDSMEKSPVEGGAQICFYNSGFGAGVIKRRGFDSKAFLVKRLKDADIPLSAVAWIDDYKTAAQKQILFRNMRNGTKRILLGSAKKMGTGVNVQNRLSHLHYLDAPWYPADVEQPDGRILRQGNQNAEVDIRRYATKGSYDATLWQMITRKARFIEQAFIGDESIRIIEDISESSQYEMAAALASGDDRIIKLVNLRADIERLQLLESAHRRGQDSLQVEKQLVTRRTTAFKKKIKALKDTEHLFPARIGTEIDADIDGKKFTERKKFGEALIVQVQNVIAEGARAIVKIGVVNGVDINASPPSGTGRVGLSVSVGKFQTDVSNTYTDLQTWKESGAVGLTLKITNTINKFAGQKQELTHSLKAEEDKLIEIDKRLGAPFEYIQELMDKVSGEARLEQEIVSEDAAREAEIAEATETAKATEATEAAETEKKKTEKEDFYVFAAKDEEYVKLGPEYEVKPLTAEQVGMEGADTFFLHKAFKSLDKSSKPPGWAISERRSGLRAAFGSTKQQAFADLKESLGRITKEDLERLVESSIKKYGKPGEEGLATEEKQPSTAAADRVLSSIESEKGSSELINDLSILGADIIRSGYESFKAFVGEMQRILGEAWIKVKPMMREAYAAAKRTIQSERGAIGTPADTKIDTSGHLPPKAEKRMAGAKLDKKKDFRKTLEEIKHQRHHFPDLQTIEDEGLRARVNDILRRHQEVPEVAKNKAIQLITSFTAGLSKDGYGVYRMNIILADMMRDIRNGLTYDGKLPFGFETIKEVEEAYANFQETARRYPEIAKALRKRSDAVNDIKRRLVKAKQLKKEVLKEEDYFHHQVIQYWEKKYGMGTGSQDVRTHWRPWQAARKGSPLDYNTDYLEAEFTAISQQLAKLGTVETLKRTKKEADVYVSLKKQAQAENIKRLWKLLADRGEIEIHEKTGKPIDPLLPWKQKIAMSNTNLAQMASEGTLEYDSEWQELVDALAESYDSWKANKDDIPDHPRPGVNDARWFDFLSYIVNTKKSGANWAATILKAIQDRNRFIKDTLGERFVTYQNMIPQGYVVWKPDPNKGWFWVNVVIDKILAKMQSGELDPKDVEAKQLLAKGHDIIWVIPEGLAKTLDNMRGYADPAMAGQVSEAAMRAWKQYILLNPYSVVRYNLNNASGDFDICWMCAPEIVTKYAWKSFVDLRRWHKRLKLDPKIQEEIDFAQESGAIQSGFSVQDVNDVYSVLHTDRIVRDILLNERPGWFTSSEWYGAKRLATNYYVLVRRLTALRENVLRLAAYRYFENNTDKRLYGASKVHEVDAIPDHREQSAKKARELLGDYGNISRTGEYLRKRIAPFYCVPEDTEILTRDGWKTYLDLCSEESVLTYDMDTRQTEWQGLQDYAVFDFNGELITLSNKYGFKFQFTEEHRVPVLEQYKDNLKIVQAKELRSHHKIPIVAPHKFEGESILSEQDAAVLGWIVTDGYCRQRGLSFESMIYQSPKNYVQEIRTAFADYISSESVHPDTGVICFRLKAAKTKEIFKVFTSYDDLPAIVARLDEKACYAMREAMMMGDGADAGRNGRSFTQTRQSVIDAFQILCYQLGEAFHVRPTNKYDSIIHGGYIKSRDKISVQKWKTTLEPYSGKVWCPQTPNKTWVMRQNGKVMITGNSWLEINSPRYVYLMRNTKYENRDADSIEKRMAVVAGKKLVLSAGGMALRASMLMGAVMLWNMTVFPDEEEELGETGRRQMHLILGRREDGSIVTLRFQGALSDALSFFGLEDWPSDMKDVLTGKRTVLEKLQEMPKALLNRGIQSIRPEPKLLGETISGKSFYPDIFRPLPIRDRVEHVLRTVKLDKIYRAAMERPGRGKTPGASRPQQIAEHFVGDLKSVLVYESDPGLLAYYDVRQMTFEWLAKRGDEKKYGGTPTKKGNAFYYYKQALKYGDLRTAKKYLQKYYELGGTPRSRLKSIEYAHPLAGLSGSKRIAFRQSLTPTQEAKLERAGEWYAKTYRAQM